MAPLKRDAAWAVGVVVALLAMVVIAFAGALYFACAAPMP
jgi:hypothetical protein